MDNSLLLANTTKRFGEADAHTGEVSVRLGNSDGQMLNFGSISYTPDAAKLKPGRKYLISYWVTGINGSSPSGTKPFVTINNNATPTIPNSQSENKKVTVNGKTWYLHSGIFTFPENCTSIKLGCSGTYVYVDDFRIQPVEANLMGYVYNQWGELTNILDDNNLYTEFTYDAMGRLVKTTKETFSSGVKKINEIKYHHANQ
jgi:hypothetical protein